MICCPVMALCQLTSKLGICRGRAGARTVRFHSLAFDEQSGLLCVSILGWHQPGAAGTYFTRLMTHQQQGMKHLAGDGEHDEYRAWPQPQSNMLISHIFKPLLGTWSSQPLGFLFILSSSMSFSNSVGATLCLPTLYLLTHFPKIFLIPARKFVFCKLAWKRSSLRCSSFHLNILFTWTLLQGF